MKSLTDCVVVTHDKIVDKAGVRYYHAKINSLAESSGQILGKMIIKPTFGSWVKVRQWIKKNVDQSKQKRTKMIMKEIIYLLWCQIKHQRLWQDNKDIVKSA